MQFESWSAFWHMGGYGFFVWLAFAVSFAALLAILVESKYSQKLIRVEVLKEAARKQRVKASRKAQQSSNTTSESEVKTNES